MQNFRKKAYSLAGKFLTGKTVACMLSVAMAAVIFWGISLTGNTDTTTRELTVAESIRAAGDTLTASSDPTKFTGKSSTLGLTGKMLDASNPSFEEAELEEVEDVPIEQENIAKEKQIDITEKDEKEESRKFLGSSKEFLEIEKKTIEVEEAITHPVEERESSLLKPGQKRVIQTGLDGSKTVIYEQKFVNGKLEEEEAVSETVHQEPVSEIVLVGASGKNAAVSPLDFGVELNEQGVPIHYSRLLTNQVATGYHAGNGAWGASGQSLSAGYVAVHPGEIPYGTKMYITSADNSFVYGFAIAADTGLGLLGDVIDVDLYYDTYLESCLNGRRNVNIYILD